MTTLVLLIAGFISGTVLMGILSNRSGSGSAEHEAFRSGYQQGYDEARRELGISPERSRRSAATAAALKPMRSPGPVEDKTKTPA